MKGQIPFLRLLIPFVLGILLALESNFPISSYLLLVFLLVSFSLIITAQFVKSNWLNRWVFGIITYLFLFASGLTLTIFNRSESLIKTGEQQNALIKVLDSPEVRLSSTRVSVRLIALKENDEWIEINERSLAYFSVNDTLSQSLEYGSIIIADAIFNEPPVAKNPFQFDYRNYLKKKNIHRVTFIPSESWLLIDKKDHWLFSNAFLLRQSLLEIFEREGIRDENLAVLSALTMGYKTLLDQETRRVFSASGAMHILAVSGLHVGILFATLSAFLFFLNRIRRGRIIKAFILVLFLWFFAVFTGLSPSVIRASLMFTLVIIASAISYKTNIYNTISASAFIILVANPMLITEVGFQLSYFAVISIVFFYPYIYKLVYIKNKWIDKVWVLISVSLAAQLGTFVLGLFYFNQFPNYFLLTNLYAIPIAFIVIYLTIGLIAFSAIPMLVSFFGSLLDYALSILVYLIRLTESLPYSTTVGVSISQTQTVVLIVAIVTLAFFLEYRKPVYLKVILLLGLAFYIEKAIIFSNQFNQSELVVFSNRQSSIIGFKQGYDLILFSSDSSKNQVAENYNYAIGGYLNKIGLNGNLGVISMQSDLNNAEVVNNLAINTSSIGHWFTFKNRSLFVPVGGEYKDYSTEIPLDLDILLVTSLSTYDFDHLLSMFNPKLVLVDETIPNWRMERIRESSKAKGVNFHATSQDGAFVL
jgi:competence protein ComEC